MSSYSGHQNHVLQCIKLRQTRYVSWNGKLNQDMYHHHNSTLHEQLIYSKLQNLGTYRITCIMMTVSWYILFSCTPTDKLVMQGAWPGIVLMVFLHTSQRSYRKLTVSSLHHTLRPCYQGAVSIRKTVFPGMAIPMLKIRRPSGRLIFNMVIAIRR